MNSKKYVIEVSGEEVIHHSRRITVEVPESTTATEIEELCSSVFDAIPEPPEWEVEESEGIWADGQSHEIVREASSDELTHARLVRNVDGELVLCE